MITFFTAKHIRHGCAGVRGVPPNGQAEGLQQEGLIHVRVWRPGGLCFCCRSSFAVRIVYLVNFEAYPVPGLQPDGVCGSCFPGASAPACVVSGLQPGFPGLGSATRDVGQSLSGLSFFVFVLIEIN